MENFKKYSQYFDLLYSEKNYSLETSYVDKHIKTRNPYAIDILELGSGTGNHAQFFSAAGYAVTGIERSAEMAAIADAKQIHNFTTVAGDMTSFDLGKQFDAVISLFHSLCYLTTNDQLIDCFGVVHRHLKPGGTFCFDFWYGPGVLHDLPVKRIKTVKHEKLNITRIAETDLFPAENVAVVNYEMTISDEVTGASETINEKHPMRYFSIPEIELIARSTGFEMLQTETFLKGGTPELADWNAFSVLQKRER